MTSEIEQHRESERAGHEPVIGSRGRAVEPWSLGSVAGMRRLLLLVSVLVCVDTMLYAALTPLLPHFADEFGLSKARAGVLVAAYAAGALVGGLPGGCGHGDDSARGAPCSSA